MKITQLRLNYDPGDDTSAPLIGVDVEYDGGLRLKSYITSLSDKQARDPMVIGQALADIGRKIQADAMKRGGGQ